MIGPQFSSAAKIPCLRFDNDGRLQCIFTAVYQHLLLIKQSHTRCWYKCLRKPWGWRNLVKIYDWPKTSWVGQQSWRGEIHHVLYQRDYLWWRLKATLCIFLLCSVCIISAKFDSGSLWTQDYFLNQRDYLWCGVGVRGQLTQKPHGGEFSGGRTSVLRLDLWRAINALLKILTESDFAQSP